MRNFLEDSIFTTDMSDGMSSKSVTSSLQNVHCVRDVQSDESRRSLTRQAPKTTILYETSSKSHTTSIGMGHGTGRPWTGSRRPSQVSWELIAEHRVAQRQRDDSRQHKANTGPAHKTGTLRYSFGNKTCLYKSMQS